MATDVPAFDEMARRDPVAVRRYRAALAARDRPGFGFSLAGDVELVGGSIPRFRSRSDELVVFAPAGRRGIVQLTRGRVVASGQARWRLQRAAYTQLTEGGPLPPPSDRLGAVAYGGVPGAFALAFAETQEEAEREAWVLARDAAALLERELRERTAARDIAWLLDCVACDAGGGAVALLADPEILPLVWTRDGYWIGRALLAAGGARGRGVVEGFVRWCFERAERVDGLWWPRSSLATGEIKDRAFQLDQQLYPLLLLAEVAGPLLDRYRAAADAHLDALLARGEGGLVATSETPADDRLDEPFHFSSHVLLWRTLAAFGRDGEPLRRLIRDGFTDRGRFAYAIGTGARHYHDANDLPTVLAPEWGFCSADDPVWRSTVSFAWSRENAGYTDGPLGGLGSLHTPHPWPLGDLQRVIVARAIGDAQLEHDAWARLERVQTWDGLLPEAYNERDGAVASRHWFAWPVALRALLRH